MRSPAAQRNNPHNSTVDSFVVSPFGAFQLNSEGTLRPVDPERPLNPFVSRKISLVGLRLGDEGKGRAVEEFKIVLQELLGIENSVAMIVKVNGGANSGHTIYDSKGNKYALNLIPAGVIDPSIHYLGLGADVVADPLKLQWEGLPLEKAGHQVWDRLRIDSRTMISDITHRIRDLAQEANRETPLGSTGRGIAAAYEDRGDKSHISYSVFLGNKEDFAKLMRERIKKCYARLREYGVTEEQWNRIFDYDPPKGSIELPGLMQRELRANAAAIEDGIFSASEFHLTRFKGPEPFTLNEQAIIDEYWEAGQKIRNSIVDIGELTLEVLDKTKSYIIYEHGQAIGLDVLHGDTPFTTSSNTTASDIPHSGRTRTNERLHVVLVCKAYETSVGTHTLLAPMGETHALAHLLMPQEKGATTGRQRLVSWPCAVQMGDAIRWHGADDLVVNKLDQLTHRTERPKGSDTDVTWDGPLKICVGYRNSDGMILRHMPLTQVERRSLEPIYLELPGWKEDISEMRDFAELPIEAQRYIATLYAATINTANEGIVKESLRQYPRIPFVGVGPKQEEVVRNVPLPEKLLELAYQFSIGQDGKVQMLPDLIRKPENTQGNVWGSFGTTFIAL